ncbi:MAG: hypothetical protein IPK26_30650 [Planctomycetes bacterium]|nr:hypothetical protein [Planctomycetota bacterium]
MYDMTMKSSDKRRRRTKPITVRVAVDELRFLMRRRKSPTQSDLINTLLAEEVERTRSHAVLMDSTGTVVAADFDDRLL